MQCRSAAAYLAYLGSVALGLGAAAAPMSPASATTTESVTVSSAFAARTTNLSQAEPAGVQTIFYLVCEPFEQATGVRPEAAEPPASFSDILIFCP
jgi:hypothetical protein